MDNLSTINTYAFVLGRERELCLAELKAVFFRFGFCFPPEFGRGVGDNSLADNVAFINIKRTDDRLNESTDDEYMDLDIRVAQMMKILGGTIKIFKIIGPMTNNIKSTLENYIENNLKKEGKFNFALSSYSTKFDQRRINSLGLEMKKDFKGKYSSRFVQLREGKEVSTILSLKSKLVDEGFEFGLFNESIGILVATTDPVEWSVRDYEKPAGDKYSGMLPPKVARMMINLALGCHSRLDLESRKVTGLDPRVKPEDDKASCLVVDPFCGSGNILLEAMVLGCDVFGSDVSAKAVRDSQENVEWLEQSQNYKAKVKIITADATSADFISLIENYKFKIANYDCMAVVCEPYLGEPKKYKPSLSAARGEYKKIKEIYLNFFNNLLALQTNKMSLTFCIVFPLVETIEGTQYSLYRDCVDEIKKIGYTELRFPLIYGRDYQVVKREIALLTLN